MKIIDKFLGKKETIGIQQAPGQLPLQIIKGTEENQPQAAHPSIGRENQPIIDALTLTKKVAVQLCRDGFSVIDINIGSRNPVIRINPSRRCQMLGGTWIKRQQGATIALITMAASIDGVQIEWVVPDHG